MFKELFRIKPKWQHRDMEVRRRAIESLGPDDGETLRRILREEEQPGLRRIALQHLCDLPLLAEVMVSDTDAVVRELAHARFRKLLAGDASGREAALLPPPGERVHLAERHVSPDLAAWLAVHAPAPEMRGAMIPFVEDEAVLGGVAIADKVLSVRLAAVERLADRETLERVYRELRKRDKQVSRRARERLDRVIEDEARPARIRGEAERLCERVEKLGRAKQWEQDDATLGYIAVQWEKLAGEAGPLLPADLGERYTQARETYLAAAGAWHREQQARRESEESRSLARIYREKVLEQLEVLQGEIRQGGPAPEAEVTTGFRERLVELQHSWEVMDPLPEPEQRRLQGRFDHLYEDLSGRLELADQRRSTAAIAEEMAQQLQELLGQRAPLVEEQVRELARRLRTRVESLPHDGAHQPLRERQAELFERLEQRLAQQQSQRKEKLNRLPQWLDEFEAQIDAGSIREATTSQDRIQGALRLFEAEGKGGKELHQYQQRLKQLMPRFRELQGWRKWAVGQERERLCAEMESLVGQPLHPTTLAEQIRALQQEWKKLDAGRATPAGELWERFQGASRLAYEPVRIYEEEQAAERERNRQAREAFIAEAGTWLDGLEGAETPDWKVILDKEREVRQGWREFGPVERRHWEKLERGYRGVMERIEEKLRPERERGLRERRNLVARIEELARTEDIAKAVDETKRLQGQWQVAVPAQRKEEERLWRAFRAACDAVFEKRRESWVAREQEEQGGLERKRALCAEIESLTAGLELAGLEEARQRLHQIHGEWAEAGRVPKPEVQNIERRFRDVVTAFDRRAAELEAARRRAGFDRLRDKAALCLELERLAEQGGEVGESISGVQARWEAIPALEDREAERSLQQRYGQALAAVSGEEEARRRLLEERGANRETRERLCLHMEVLAGVDSPAEAQEARMTFQVNRLATAMHQGKQSPDAEAKEVETAWHLTGFAGAEPEAKLAERFERARGAFS